MADSDRQRWNERYQQASTDFDFEPAPWLRTLVDQIRPRHAGARALDVASGPGNQALFLAELGYTVDAWDISDVALERLAAELRRRAVAGQLLAVRPRQVDLERTPILPAAFDLILDKHYLDRALFAPMIQALRPGGLLIVHTFLHVPNGARTGQLSNPLHALKRGELRDAFGDQLEILNLSEDEAREEAHLLARKPMVVGRTDRRRLGDVHEAVGPRGGV